MFQFPDLPTALHTKIQTTNSKIQTITNNQIPIIKHFLFVKLDLVICDLFVSCDLVIVISKCNAVQSHYCDRSYPIRTPSDQSLLTTPRCISLSFASFFGFSDQGIHHLLYLNLPVKFHLPLGRLGNSI